MSIASELSALNGYILGAYDEISDKGGTVPQNKNMANLASAIESISGRRPLPEGYTEVEWLQSDGACYIDLNRVPNMDDIVKQKFMSLNTTSITCSWYGSMPAGNIVIPRFSMGISAAGNGKFFVGVNQTCYYMELNNEIHTIEWQQQTSTNMHINIDNTELDITTSSAYTPAVRLTSYLFARHGNDGVQVYDGAGTRIYYHKEYLANGTIQVDLVPVIRNSDNEPGMYDLVNRAFYANGGGGSFTTGPAIESSITIVPLSVTENGTYTAPTGTAYRPVTVNVAGGGGVGIPREVNANGVYGMPTQSFAFSLPSDATDAGRYALYYAFQECTGLTSVDLSSLTTVSGYNALAYAFQSCSALTSVDLSSLTTVSAANALYYAFFNCASLTSVNLSSLTTVSGYNALSCAFQGCTSLTSVDLSSLTTMSGGSALSSAFRRCTSLTTLSFPALTASSFGNYSNQFNNMLREVTGCTVHFPAAIQSTIGSWSSVTNGFGGTNTTVLFDL